MMQPLARLRVSVKVQAIVVRGGGLLEQGQALSVGGDHAGV